MSSFYRTDPKDPDAPVELTEYDGPNHGVIRPGDRVAYENPAYRQHDGTYWDGGLSGPLVVTEIIDLGGDFVTAILNGGETECSAVNLRSLEGCQLCQAALNRDGSCSADCAGVGDG